MNTFEWEDGTVVERPYVEINGNKYYVQEGTISGGTTVSSANLNEMQNILNGNIPIPDIVTNGDEVKMPYKVDGKDVYAKKISFTTPSTESDYIVEHNIADLNKLIKLYGMIEDSTPIPYTIWFENIPYYTSIRIIRSTNEILYRGSSAYGNKTAYLIVEYIKN